MYSLTCKQCLKGFDSPKDNSKFCNKGCWNEYRNAGKVKHETRKDKGVRTNSVTVSCSYCNVKFEKQAAESKKTERHFCCREHYRLWLPGKSVAGRPRTRPGGEGLPDFAQPETVAASCIWPVLSWFDDNGYILLYMPSCPYSSSSGRIYEHRLLMCLKEDRKLQPGEHVDHINQIKNDNRMENLQILSPSAHMKKTYKENTGSWRDFSKTVKTLGYTPDEALAILWQYGADQVRQRPSRSVT